MSVVQHTAKYYPWVARMVSGFYLGMMGTSERVPQHALLFFDGEWILYRGCQFRSPSFQGAIDNAWVYRSGIPPFSGSELQRASGVESTHASIIQVFWEAPGKWRGENARGETVAHLTDRMASDIFRLRKHWEVPSVGYF